MSVEKMTDDQLEIAEHFLRELIRAGSEKLLTVEGERQHRAQERAILQFHEADD